MSDVHIDRSVNAVSHEEFLLFGCPQCGYRSGYSTITVPGCTVWRCASETCGHLCCILEAGITKSPVEFGEEQYRPELAPHPRRGIPAHGRADARPDGPGEFFHSRGTGLDMTPGCFICGGTNNVYHNIAGFVETKDAGERVIAMFNSGARLDYREYESDRVQVKIGACSRHTKALNRLDQMIRRAGVITPEIIDAAYE